MLICLYRGNKRRPGILPSGPPNRKVRLITATSLKCSVPWISDACRMQQQREMPRLNLYRYHQ